MAAVVAHRAGHRHRNGGGYPIDLVWDEAPNAPEDSAGGGCAGDYGIVQPGVGAEQDGDRADVAGSNGEDKRRKDGYGQADAYAVANAAAQPGRSGLSLLYCDQ